MLPVHMEVAESAVKKINKNVYYMFDLFLSSCEGLDYETFLIDIFPTFYLNNNVNGCTNIVVELMEMTKDSYKRDYLKPIYEYALYMLIEWWIEVTDDVEAEMSEIIKSEEIYSDEVDLTDYINDVKNYKAILFDDWDFLDVPNFFETYRANPLMYTEIFHIDLDEYIDLMPNDIKEEYLLLKRENEVVNKKEILRDDESYIIRSIYNQIQLFTRHSLSFCKKNIYRPERKLSAKEARKK